MNLPWDVQSASWTMWLSLRRSPGETQLCSEQMPRSTGDNADFTPRAISLLTVEGFHRSAESLTGFERERLRTIRGLGGSPLAPLRHWPRWTFRKGKESARQLGERFELLCFGYIPYTAINGSASSHFYQVYWVRLLVIAKHKLVFVLNTYY